MESDSVCICLSANSILGMCMRSGRAPLSQVSSQEVAADFLSLNLMSLSSSLGPAFPLQDLLMLQIPQATWGRLRESASHRQQMGQSDPLPLGPGTLVRGSWRGKALLPPGSWFPCLSWPRFLHLWENFMPPPHPSYPSPGYKIFGLPRIPSEKEAGKRSSLVV